MVGKYTGLIDAYKSLNEALIHGGIATTCGSTCAGSTPTTSSTAVSPGWQDVNAILVPGGFGERGSRARSRPSPMRGPEAAVLRHLLRHAARLRRGRAQLVGINGASCTEFGPCPDPIVGLLTEWDQTAPRAPCREGRSRRDDAAGSYPARSSPRSLAAGSMAPPEISERHRHRYEVNVNYRPALERAGLRFSGMSPDGRLPEIIELPEHPWFVGVQFHPELKSRPLAPHPLFAAFVKAAIEQSRPGVTEASRGGGGGGGGGAGGGGACPAQRRDRPASSRSQRPPPRR